MAQDQVISKQSAIPLIRLFVHLSCWFAFKQATFIFEHFLIQTPTSAVLYNFCSSHASIIMNLPEVPSKHTLNIYLGTSLTPTACFGPDVASNSRSSDRQMDSVPRSHAQNIQ